MKMLNTTRPTMILGYELNFDMIAFFACLLISLILLLVLLVGAAGKSKRESKYIAKANANTAKIPVRSTSTLPHSGQISEASGKRRESDVRQYAPAAAPRGADYGHEAVQRPVASARPSAQERPAVPSRPARPVAHERAETPSVSVRPASSSVQNPSAKRAFSIPSVGDSATVKMTPEQPAPNEPMQPAFCPMCGNPAKGKFCAKCGQKL